MGIKDILSMGLNEFNMLKESQLRSLTNKLVSAANKRVRRFQAAGVKSPALSKVEQEGIFSTRNKSFNELRQEFARTRRFLQSETGNLRGAKRVQNQVINNLNRSGVNITRDQYNAFFDAYEKLKQQNPEVAERRFKYMAMKEISDRINDDTDPAAIAEALANDFNSIYEATEEQEQDEYAISEFFETDGDF